MTESEPLTNTSEPGWGGRTIALPRGKVLGGSSAINAGTAVRAPEVDFQRWTSNGLPNWAHRDVLTFFKRMERNSHGSDAGKICRCAAYRSIVAAITDVAEGGHR
jgi:choline dehydrogenase-like flavoprotein